MPGELKITETIPVRRSDISALRDMLILLEDQGGLGYSAWLTLSLERGVLLRQDGRPASDSTFWHHLNALRTLGLAHKTDGYWDPTGAGREIVVLGGFQDAQLSDRTRECFSQAILGSPFVRENYLVLFTGDPEADLFESGSPISYFQYQRGLYAIVTEHADTPLELNYSQTEGILWGMRLWCLQSGLMDEIRLPPRADVPRGRRVRLFPVRSRGHELRDPERFTAVLRRYLGDRTPAYGETIKADIPLLLFRLCPGERLRLSQAKRLLWSWLQERRSGAFVEAASSPAGRASRLGANQRKSRPELGAYLEKEGTLYSVLFINKRLLEGGEENGS